MLSGILGHASEMSPDAARQEYAKLFAADETVALAYKLVRDVIILTNRRLVLIDKQGMTGRKVEYMSVPYRSITRFSVETAGTFDLEAELKIWVSGATAPIEKTFSKHVDVYALQAQLAAFVGR